MPAPLPRLGLTLALLMSLSACKQQQQQQQAKSATAGQILTVSVTKVRLEEVPRYYSVTGSVKADERIQISSRITGYIQKIAVHEGDKVRKGAILVEIDPTDTEAAIRRGEAAVRSATTTLADAERDAERSAELKSKQVVSEEGHRKATVRRDVARSNLAEVKAALDSLVAQRRYASIESPVDGIAVARFKEQGDLAAPGVPILTIDSGKRFLFAIFVAESQIGNIHIGSKVDVTIDALGDNPLAGTVLRITPSGDPVSRRYQVDIALPEGIKAYAGMFGRAQFVAGVEWMPVVAREALVERGGLQGVFVIDEAGHARFRWLRTGREWIADGQVVRVAVKAGLEGGETILARDDQRVRDGVLIAVAEKAASHD